MPNRLNLPDELESLIEKRELQHRREEDRLRAARKEKRDEEAERQATKKVKAERRKNKGRRKEDPDF